MAANTISMTLNELEMEHIIPVFAKDNYPIKILFQLGKKS
jgi:hypothetical protein